MIVQFGPQARGEMATQRFSDADLIAALTQVALQLDGNLSVASYDRFRSVDQPSSALIIQRFGNWRSAVTKANLVGNVASRSYHRSFELADAVAVTKNYLATTAKPSYQDFAQWRKSQPSAPSAQTCRNLAGSWQQLLALAKR